MNRRRFITSTAVAGATLAAGCATSSLRFGGIVDTHTHFYDPGRPEGVPWPPADDPVLSRTVLPAEFESLAKPFGVIGTVVVEASPWVEDNQWLLELADQNPFLLGIVGNLKPGTPDFKTQLRRFVQNRRFCGIRVGGDTLEAALAGGAAQNDLRQLADSNLSLDLLIGPEQLPGAAQLGNAIPDLRIIVDHCANVPVGSPPPNLWIAGLSACHYAPNVSMKVSGLVEGTGRRGGQAPTDLAYYRSVLDSLWATFGEDRLIYGSNWPVCLHFASYATVLAIVEEYFTAKSERSAAKYFRRNAARVYQYIGP
ncbi:MAG TPA: amidohydrolase family protein [Verrucomicrobiota bacterium]|nr:amidohydrolase [Verrucomicrobiales bacterium]HRI15006.1 amidohydrolase family protein [Verrucomicrobiota bacterium]